MMSVRNCSRSSKSSMARDGDVGRANRARREREEKCKTLFYRIHRQEGNLLSGRGVRRVGVWDVQAMPCHRIEVRNPAE
jgi:hypothetical protein